MRTTTASVGSDVSTAVYVRRSPSGNDSTLGSTMTPRSSSSAMVTVNRGGLMVRPELVVPVTVNVSSSSSMSSSTG